MTTTPEILPQTSASASSATPLAPRARELPPLLSTEQVAAWVGRSGRTIRGWARDGLLRKHRVGRGIFYREDEVLAALQADFEVKKIE
jgi:excisionase family DNA binding protein